MTKENKRKKENTSLLAVLSLSVRVLRVPSSPYRTGKCNYADIRRKYVLLPQEIRFATLSLELLLLLAITAKERNKVNVKCQKKKKEEVNAN